MTLSPAEVDNGLLEFVKKRVQNQNPLAPVGQTAMNEYSPDVDTSRRQETQQMVVDALNSNQDMLEPITGSRFDQYLNLNGVKVPVGLSSANPSPLGETSNGGNISMPEGMNGQLSGDMLVSIGGGHKLQPAAAYVWNQMVHDAAKDGVHLTLTDSYRDLATQERLVREKGLYSQGGLAAEPGTSNHGWGLAVDVKSGREWLAKNAAKYGFHTIPREPWHWEYEGGGAKANGHPNQGRPGRLTSAMAWLIDQESDYDVHADNPNSTAFGIGQLLIDNRKKYGRELGVDPNTTDYNEQLAMMREYIEDRYGNAKRAKRFHQQHGWY